MNNGRYVDKDTIIKRVRQYYGFDASGKDINDFIYDGLRGIGKYKMYDLIATSGINDMPDPIVVKNYRGVLPNNIEYPMAVIDYDSQIPLLCKDSIFREDFMYTPYNSYMTYSLKKNHIFTSEENQNLVMVYLGFPLDNTGQPLVVDNENYLKAITAFVAMNLARPLYLKGQLTRDRYLEVCQEYYSLADSTDEMEMLNVSEMEMLKNQALSFLPDTGAFFDNFRSLGMPTKIQHV